MPDNTEAVNAVCEAMRARGEKVSIADRNAIARDLFSTESEDVHREYTAKAKDRLDEENAKYAADLSGEAPSDPAEQEE